MMETFFLWRICQQKFISPTRFVPISCSFLIAFLPVVKIEEKSIEKLWLLREWQNFIISCPSRSLALFLFLSLSQRNERQPNWHHKKKSLVINLKYKRRWFDDLWIEKDDRNEGSRCVYRNHDIRRVPLLIAFRIALKINKPKEKTDFSFPHFVIFFLKWHFHFCFPQEPSHDYASLKHQLKAKMGEEATAGKIINAANEKI